MVPIERREFVVASGIVASALAGCLSRNDDDSDDAGSETLPDDLQTVLDPIPERVGESSIQFLATYTPSTDGQENGAAGYSKVIGVDPSQVDRVATVSYGRQSGNEDGQQSGNEDDQSSGTGDGQQSGTVTVFAGTFEESDVSEPEGTAVSISDGLVLTAWSSQAGWTAGIDAATEAKDDPDAGVVANAAVQSLFEPLADAQQAQGILTVDGEMLPPEADIDTDAAEAIGFGTTNDVDAREQTLTIVAVFTDDASPDASVVEEIVRAGDVEIAPESIDVDTDDRRAMTTFTRELPRSELPNNSPDTFFGFEYDPDSGVVTITHDGGDAVDASEIELRVGGERVEAPWGDTATVEAGDSYEVEAPLHALVRIVWIDPDLDGLEHSLGGQVVGLPGSFEVSYDADAEAFTITYTGSATLDAEGFVVRRWEDEFEEYDVPLTEFTDSLESGSELEVPDEHGAGEIRLLYTPDEDASLPPETLFWYDAEHSGGEGSDAEGSDAGSSEEGSDAGTSSQGSDEDGASDGADE